MAATQFLKNFSSTDLFVFLWCTSVEFYFLQIKGFSCYSDRFYLLIWQVRLNHRWKETRDVFCYQGTIFTASSVYISWSLCTIFLFCRCLFCSLLERIEFLVLYEKVISNSQDNLRTDCYHMGVTYLQKC